MAPRRVVRHTGMEHEGLASARRSRHGHEREYASGHARNVRGRLATGAWPARVAWTADTTRRAGVVLVLGVILALEPLTPLGFAHGTLYVLPVVLAGVAQDRRLVVAIGILAVLAIAVGAAIAAPTHPDFPEIYVVGNRIGSVLAVIATSALAYAMLGRVVDAHTARRTAEDAHAAVAARDDLLRMAGEVARFGGWSVRLADGHLSWSPEVARLFDQPAGVPALSLEQAFDAYTSSCRERVRAVFEACAERGTPFDEEAELAHADGSTVWVRTGHVRDRGRIVEVRHSGGAR